MKISKQLLLAMLIACILSLSGLAQYPPPAGQPGTTAIHRDSNLIIGWAVDCEITRGYINVADTTVTYEGTNKATYGSYLYASGPSDEYVVSLGDHGYAILHLDPPVVNREGPDFAVFENSFGDLFLELAFVEVSSDGQRFVRFPSITLVEENQQVPTFGTLDATRIHNFAGKYRMGYGTPFDLDDIKDSLGIDPNHITHVRIVDVVGCIDPLYATYDSQGHAINDPWPTPFDTGGFDLDAVGVIHNTTEGTCEILQYDQIKTFPNPVEKNITIQTGSCDPVTFELLSLDGRVLFIHVVEKKSLIDMAPYQPGLYIARFSFANGLIGFKKIMKK